MAGPPESAEKVESQPDQDTLPNRSGAYGRRWFWHVPVLIALPFVVLWRLWTPNFLDRAFIWQDITDTAYPFLVFLND